MKKFLLSAVAAATAVTMSAELTQVGKIQVNNPFNEEEIIYNAPVAIDNDGELIASGAFNRDISINFTKLSNIGNSAYLVKSNRSTNYEAWAVGIIGSASVTKIVTDTDNNIYVAGQYADEVTFGTTSGEEIVIEGMMLDGAATVEQNSAFIAKYNKDGQLLAVRSFVPQIQADLLPLIDDWEAFPIYMYFDGEVRFQICDICTVGDRLYVATSYNGVTKIDDLTLDASYVNYDGWMYCDNRSAAIFSLDSELADATLVDQISSTVNNGDYTENTYEVWNARFDVVGSDMVVAYTGIGELNYNGSVIELADAPIFIFSSFKDGQFVNKKIVPTADSMINSFNSVVGVKIVGDNAYAVGNKYTDYLDGEETAYKNEAFVATIPSLDVNNIELTTAELTYYDALYYQLTSAAFTEAGPIYMTSLSYWQSADDVHKKGELAGNGDTFVFNSGSIANDLGLNTNTAANNNYVAFSSVDASLVNFWISTYDAAGIDDITVDDSNAPVEYFNLQGVKVANPENGLYIIRQGNTTTKQIIR